MQLTISQVGALMLVAFGTFHLLGIFATIRAYLAFLGIVVIGSSGFLGHALTSVAMWAQNTGGSILQWAVGVPLVAAPALVLFIFLLHDLHPKNTTGKRTGFLALAAGAVVVAGVAGIPALAGLHDQIVKIVGDAGTLLSSLQQSAGR